MAPIDGGGDVFLVGSGHILGGTEAALMLGMLPPIIHLAEEGERATLRWLVERMRQDLCAAKPGSDLAAQHPDAGKTSGPGWFGALADRQWRSNVAAIHAEPARRWTVASLAQTAAMSRSSFALEFRELAGDTPMDYLARGRMFLALDRLKTGAAPSAESAEGLGYSSESSVSTAFKHVIGRAPRQFFRANSQGSPHRPRPVT